MMQPLNRKTSPVASTRPVRVVQFGEGNFLRAFVDWMIELMNERTGFNGDVQIIQPIGTGMGAAINAQDGLYHVVLNGIRNGKPVRETRKINCVRGVLNPYENPEAFRKLGENPELEFIFSNTTESGIAFDGTDTNPEVLAKSFPGKVAQLLYHRFKFFNGAPDKGLIVIPCELIDKNGTRLKEIILHYAELWKLPASFAAWVNDQNTFCNTLVDRIVPGFPKDEIADIQKELGFDDKLVVMAEPFHLWVIEAPSHAGERFPADKAGLDVKFVSDQAPYRTRKVRILNGAHTALVPVAYLAGLRTVRESIDDASVGKYIREAIHQEIIPTLDLPIEELKSFAHDVVERFQNPYIRHELASIALNSISKFKVRVLPSLLEYVNRTGQLPERLTYSLACLIRFYKGEWKDEVLPVNDSKEIIEFFTEAWKSANEEDVARKVLSQTAFWDTDLTLVPNLVGIVAADLKMLNALQAVAV